MLAQVVVDFNTLVSPVRRSVPASLAGCSRRSRFRLWFPAFSAATSGIFKWCPFYFDSGRSDRLLVTSKQEQIPRAVRQFIHADSGFTTARVRRQISGPGFFRQFDGVQYQLQQIAVIAGVADQYCAEQIFVIFADNKDVCRLLLSSRCKRSWPRARRGHARVADAADVHAQQLQLC